VLTDLLVRHVHFRVFRNDEGEDDPFGTRPMAFPQNNLDSRQDQFPDRMTLSSSPLLELPVKRGRNINNRTNRITFNKINSFASAINME
jgi:hypothetical protein